MSAGPQSWNVPPSSSDTEEINLPEIVSADTFLEKRLEIPPELVEGMIHQRTLTMFAGGSKARKSFTLLDLAICVSQGVPWWGRNVEKGPVLYINLELDEAFLQQRLFHLADAKGLTDNVDESFKLAGLDFWNLRGYAANVDELMPKIVKRCRGRDYSMIIIDPIYKLFGGRNENAAGEMAHVLNHFDKLAHETGAAVVYAHHFAKGLAASKEQLDRASGSGVFARHADAIITMTPHEEEDAVVVEATLRNMRAPKPFVMRWDHPLMRIAHDLDPKKLKNQVGAKAKYTVAMVLDCLTDGMTTGEWQAAAVKQQGLVPSTFAKLKKEAVENDEVELKGKAWVRKPKALVVDVMTGTTEVRDATPHYYAKKVA
jgi:AAA domain